MIDYGPKVGESEWHVLIRSTGSVFPRVFKIVVPLSFLAVFLKQLHAADILTEYTAMTFTKNGTAWSGFSGLVTFVTVFRLSNAYKSYWSAFSSTNGMLSCWKAAASNVVVKTRHASVEPEVVQTFLETIIRLFSMLSACALQDLSPRENHKVWGLLTLDAEAIDSQTLSTLDGSSSRVALCFHWIQQLMVDSIEAGLLCAPTTHGCLFGELGAGMKNYGAAKKHSTTQFNFPYAQATSWLLIIYSAFMPMMMVQWSDWVTGAFIFTFLALSFIWALHFITLGMESPFDSTDPNSIDMFQLQLGMNKALLLLMDPQTRTLTPTLQKKVDPKIMMHLQNKSEAEQSMKQFEKLQKRDTVHKAVLKREGWQLKEQQGMVSSAKLNARKKSAGGGCPLCPKKAWRPDELAVCNKYCTKKFGIIDDVKTKVLPVGIFGNKLILALPSSLDGFRLNVENTHGHRADVVIKAISIADRHKLYSSPPKGEAEADYEDFIVDYKELEADVINAEANCAALPVAKIVALSDFEVEKSIEEMKEADKRGAGIDKVAALKSKDVFVAQLMEKCKLDKSAAEQEWARREAASDDYEQSRDDNNHVIIELDIEQFKKELQAKKNTVDQNILLIDTARRAGEYITLEKAKRNASADIPGMPQAQADRLNRVISEADATLKQWTDLDADLQEATAASDLEQLRGVVKTAREAFLKSESMAAAEKLLAILEEEEKRRLAEEKRKAEEAKKNGTKPAEETSKEEERQRKEEAERKQKKEKEEQRARQVEVETHQKKEEEERREKDVKETKETDEKKKTPRPTKKSQVKKQEKDKKEKTEEEENAAEAPEQASTAQAAKPGGPEHIGKFTLWVDRVKDLTNVEMWGEMDPFVRISFGERVMTTRIAKDGGTETSMRFQEVLDWTGQEKLLFDVREDDGPFGDERIGRAEFNLMDESQRPKFDGWLDVDTGGQLYISVHWE